MSITDLYPVVGIDLNHWRPVADFKRVSEQIYFAMIKVSDGWKYDDGTFEDPTFRENWDGFKDYGRARKPYMFMRFYHDASRAKKQVEEFIRILETTGELGELPASFDVEKIGFVEDVSKQEAQDFIWKALFHYENLTGIDHEEVDMYTNASTWNERVTGLSLSATDIPRKRSLTVASWRDFAPPYSPWDWVQRYGDDCWTFWQYTSLLAVDGFEANRLVDGQVYREDLATFNQVYNLDLALLPGEPPPLPEPEPEPEPVEGFSMEVVQEGLRIRSGPGLDFSIIGTLPAGQIVPVLDIGGDSAWVEIAPGQWSNVEYNGDRNMVVND